MANIKISALTPATTVVPGTDVAPLVSGGITTKATPQQIVNAGLLAPGAIGSGTASTGAFTTLSASSTVSGTGFSTYLLSPPAIGTTTPAAGKFTDLTSTGNTTIGDASADTFTVYPQTISLINSTAITAASTKTLTLNGGAGSNGLVIDASNNVGLAIAPSAWSTSGGAVLQLKGNAYIGSNTQVLSLCTNNYFNGSNYIYTSSSYANRYDTVFGEHRFYTAASGTAGNTVSFTQAMTLDASSNLTIVGATATKASGTTWANPSDTRLKDNQKLYTKGLEELLQVVVKTWEFNGKGGSSKGTKGLGVIADEIESILPESVDTYNAKLNDDDESETEIKRFDASEIIWLLVNSVQQLNSELNELKAQISIK